MGPIKIKERTLFHPKEELTHESITKYRNKWGWLCKYWFHKWVDGRNEVLKKAAFCLRCGKVAIIEGAKK